MEVGQTSPQSLVYRSTQRKTFKACRTCRLQKARCMGSENPPCRRCQATGRDCIFDELITGSSNRKRSRTLSVDQEEGNGRQSYRELEKEVHHLRHLLGSQRARPQDGSPCAEIQPSGNEALINRHVATETSPEDVNQLNLDAPITAVHIITATGLSPSPTRIHSYSSRVPPASLPNGKFARGRAASSSQKHNDIISAGIITESEARRAFQLYMVNANVFLPLFDSAVDTFDTIRQTSPFCFTVILAVALRAESPHPDPNKKAEKCFEEAQSFAVKSLFATSASLETLQAMLLLAVHSEKNWFAISHAYQMSQDMGLLDLLQQGPTDRRSLQRIRTALALHQVEQEVASGTARRAMGAWVEDVHLKALLSSRFSSLSDMRIVANVQMVQLRGRLLQALECEATIAGTVQERVENVEEAVNNWFDHWDAVFEGQDLNVGSFQRSSIRLQRDCAFIIICSAMISKLGHEMSTDKGSNIMTEEMREVSQTTFDRSTRILSFICQDNDYKWHIQWAPTYSVLFPVFTAALAFKLARMGPWDTGWRALESSFSAVAGILENHPHRHFSQVIRNLSKLCSQASVAMPKPLAERSEASRDRADSPGGNILRSSETERADSHPCSSQRSPGASDFTGQSFDANVDTNDGYSSWMADPLSLYPLPDSVGEFAIEPLLAAPDYTFDFTTFAGSIQTPRDNSE